MSNELQLRTSIIEKILKMHEELLWPCIDRWIAWRPTDHLAELRRLRAQHNPDSARQLRLPSLDDPSFSSGQFSIHKKKSSQNLPITPRFRFGALLESEMRAHTGTK